MINSMKGKLYQVTEVEIVVIGRKKKQTGFDRSI